CRQTGDRRGTKPTGAATIDGEPAAGNARNNRRLVIRLDWGSSPEQNPNSIRSPVHDGLSNQPTRAPVHSDGRIPERTIVRPGAGAAWLEDRFGFLVKGHRRSGRFRQKTFMGPKRSGDCANLDLGCD